MADTITLHGIALSGPTQKIALTLALAGKKFSYRHVNLGEGAHKKPDFLALNRYGQVPVLQHGSTTLCQSGAILIHLADTLGTLETGWGHRDFGVYAEVVESGPVGPGDKVEVLA